MTTLILIAKETVPGRVKTRLHPPLSLEQAATLAAASIADTLVALEGLPATRRILAFDGTTPPPGCEGYELVPQVSGGLDVRLGAIFDHADGPAVLVGMDTPQLTAAHLAPAFASWPAGVDAWFGPAKDGGFWALGLAGLPAGAPRGDLIRGIPMSRDDTGAHQLRRLRDAGLTVSMLPMLTDVDTIGDAFEVAAAAPDGHFSATLASFGIAAAAETDDQAAA